MGEDVGTIVSGIGPKVRGLRKQAGLSLQQLAEIADVSAAAIHKIEQSGMVPTITTLLKVAGALGRPVAYFVDEEVGSDPAVHTPDGEHRPIYTSHTGIDLAGINGTASTRSGCRRSWTSWTSRRSSRPPTSTPGLRSTPSVPPGTGTGTVTSTVTSTVMTTFELPDLEVTATGTYRGTRFAALVLTVESSLPEDRRAGLGSRA